MNFLLHFTSVKHQLILGLAVTKCQESHGERSLGLQYVETSFLKHGYLSLIAKFGSHATRLSPLSLYDLSY